MNLRRKQLKYQIIGVEVMKLKEKEVWLELYEVARKVQELEPWKYLWDMDLLEYIDVNSNEIYYCSVLGRLGLSNAILIYQGEQIHKFFEGVEKKFPEHVLINYKEHLSCQFSKRSEVLPENRELIKELGLTFRGTWTSFECFEKGYEICKINIKQAKLMTELLKNFYMMFRAIIEEKLEVDFERGEILARYYDKNKKLFLNHPAPLALPPRKFFEAGISQEALETLLKLPRSQMELEYDFINYIPIRIRNFKDEEGRHYYPRFRFIGERKSGMILHGELIDRLEYSTEETYIYDSLDKLVDQFYELGIPKKIYVRDAETEHILTKIMRKLNVELVVTPNLKAIDRAMEEFVKEM